MNNVIFKGVIGTLLLAALTQAQTPATLTSVGSATQTAPAKLLRVGITVSGEGKTAADAIKDLRQQTDAIKTKLAAFKPADGTLKITDVSFGEPADGLSPMMRQQRMMMRQMQGNQKAQPNADATINASSIITAEFTLDSEAGDDAIVKQHETQTKIAEALKESKPTRKLTPEQEELREEMAGMMDESMPTPGEPTFTYVLPLTGDELTAVTKDAIADAQKRADALAQAAGKKLGAIQTIQSGSVNPSDQMQNVYMRMMLEDAEAHDDMTEATSRTAGPITFTTTVTVQYVLD